MDMMRSLLIYLTATMALAVQGADAPKETPAPTVVPTAVVETAEAPVLPDSGDPLTAVPPEAAAAVTPAPAAVEPTPAPVPTITPNRKYHNLGVGAKGKDVVALQERLIEMGYLPEGSADGAYGRKTANAVKKFQYYNGLKQDGVAGDATQTNLFENPDAAPYPSASATAAPATEEPAADTPAPETAPADTPEAAPAETESGLPQWADELNREPAETEAPVTEAPATEPPETEAPATEAPETEPPATEAPATDSPAPILTAAPEDEPGAEETEEPEETAEPEETGLPGYTGTPEEDLPEIVENVDLDAEVYEPIVGLVALNEREGPLEFVAMEDGVPVTARPRLRQNGAKIRVSLDDLCSCEDSWVLTDDGLGTVVLEAAGYTLAVYNEEKGLSATVDGNEITIREDDMDFTEDGHFINAEFLAAALKGESEWDPEESTLMLRIRDRESVESDD